MNTPIEVIIGIIVVAVVAFFIGREIGKDVAISTMHSWMTKNYGKNNLTYDGIIQRLMTEDDGNGNEVDITQARYGASQTLRELAQHSNHQVIQKLNTYRDGGKDYPYIDDGNPFNDL